LRFETKKQSPKNHFLVSISKFQFKVELARRRQNRKAPGRSHESAEYVKKGKYHATGYMLAFAVQKHFPFNIYYYVCTVP
jgi:hypothetical protein